MIDNLEKWKERFDLMEILSQASSVFEQKFNQWLKDLTKTRVQNFYGLFTPTDKHRFLKLTGPFDICVSIPISHLLTVG